MEFLWKMGLNDFNKHQLCSNEGSACFVFFYLIKSNNIMIYKYLFDKSLKVWQENALCLVSSGWF